MKVILLAGGRGSRSENPRLPKVLQEIAPKWTILDHWIQLLGEQGFKKLDIVLGHGSQQVRSHLLHSKLRTELEISHQVDDQLSGTTNAALCSRFYGERSLVLMADTLSFLDYKRVLSRAQPSDNKVVFLAHKNSHLFDSDTVELSKDGSLQSFHRKQESTNLNDALALSGGVLLGRDAWAALRKASTRGDIVHDLFKAIPLSKIQVVPFVGLSMDCGTPNRLKKARKLYPFWKNRESLPSVVLDRDGTLIPDLPQGRRPSDDLHIDPRDAQAIASLNEAGIPVFMATNQPAIAKGWITPSDVERVHAGIEIELARFGAWLDDIVYCPHYPVHGFPHEVLELKIECACRKPNTGMMERLLSKFHLNSSDVWVIGDSNADQEFAINSSAKFVRAEHGSPSNIAAALEGIMRDWNCN